jgi:hypothetical protein
MGCDDQLWVDSGSCRSDCLAQNLPFASDRRPVDVRIHPQPGHEVPVAR